MAPNSREVPGDTSCVLLNLMPFVKEGPWITFGSVVLMGYISASLAGAKSSRASPAKDRSASPQAPEV